MFVRFEKLIPRSKQLFGRSELKTCTGGAMPGGATGPRQSARRRSCGLNRTVPRDLGGYDPAEETDRQSQRKFDAASARRGPPFLDN